MWGYYYLLIPMMPTPNGPLHLGHVAGPYLKLDVLGRYLSGQGQTVAHVSSTDAFEAYVLATARKENTAPDAIAAGYFRAICADFDRLSIRFDAFVDPSSPAEADEFCFAHKTVVDELQRKGATVATDRALADGGGRLLEAFDIFSSCGRCGQAIVGYSCESCGFSNAPHDLVQPCLPDGTQAVLVKRRGLALDKSDPDKIMKVIEGYRLPQPFIETAEVILARSELLLTAPSSLGVCPYAPYDAPLYNTYFGHAVFASRVAARSNPVFEAAFSKESPVITVTSLGIDNCVDIPASVRMAFAIESCRPFDYCFGNFFLELEGEKFSTSRNHAIFISCLSDRVSADSLRFYLATISPDTRVENFDINDYVRFHNDVYCRELIHVAANLAKSAKMFGVTSREDREEDLTFSCTSFLRLTGFSLQRYARQLLTDWRALTDTAGVDAGVLLQAFLSAAGPLVPNFCQRLRGMAAGEGEIGWIERINRRDLPIGR